MEKILVEVEINAEKSITTIEDLENKIKVFQDNIKQGFTYPGIDEDLQSAQEQLQKLNAESSKIDVNEKVSMFSKLGDVISSGMGQAKTVIQGLGIETKIFTADYIKGSELVEFALGKRKLAELGVVNAIKSNKAATVAMSAAQNVWTFAMGASTLAGKALRIALVSLGLPALLILVGTLVVNWDRIKTAVANSGDAIKEFLNVILAFNPALRFMVNTFFEFAERVGGIPQLLAGVGEALKQFFTNTGEAFALLLKGDFKGAIEAAQNAGEGVAAAFYQGVDEKSAELEREREIARIQGEIKTNERVLAERKALGDDVTELERQILADKIAILEKGTDEYLDAVSEQTQFENQLKREQADQDERDRERRIAEYRREQEERKKIRDEFDELIRTIDFNDEQRKRDNLEQQIERYRAAGVSELELAEFKARREQEITDEFQAIKDETTQAGLDRLLELQRENTLMLITNAEEKALAELEIQYQKDLAEIEGYENFLDLKAQLDENYLGKRKLVEGAIAQTVEQTRKAELQMEANNFRAKTQLISSGLGVLKGLFKENSKAAKAVAIAEAGINTYSAAWQIFNNAAKNPGSVLFPAMPFIQAGIAITAGIANIAKIAAINPESGSGGGGGGSVAVPSFGAGSFGSSAQGPPGIDFSFLGQGGQNSTSDFTSLDEDGPKSINVKAYTVSDEMTNQQNIDQKIGELSSLTPGG